MLSANDLNGGCLSADTLARDAVAIPVELSGTALTEIELCLGTAGHLSAHTFPLAGEATSRGRGTWPCALP